MLCDEPFRFHWISFQALNGLHRTNILCNLLVGTSVSCERLLSIAKHILTCVRKSRSPLVFEPSLFLKMNRHFWNDVIVGKAMERTNNQLKFSYAINISTGIKFISYIEKAFICGKLFTS